MPKSPSKRERERSRPGRLNRAFTDRSPEDLPESDAPKAHVAREAKTPMSQQERPWRRTPPPFTVYSEVYYCHGTPPQPSPVLDRILQDLLEQQEASSAVTKRPRITLKCRDTSRRQAKAEIIAKRLEAQVDRPPRPRSLPPRPSLQSREADRPTRTGPHSGRTRTARSRSRPRADVSPSGSHRQRSSPDRVRREETPLVRARKPIPKRCPLPPPDRHLTPCKDQTPSQQLGPQESEYTYTYYSSDEEGTTGQALPKDYPAGSLISRLLPTSAAAAASSETGSYESSRSLGIVTSPLQASRCMHELLAAANCRAVAAPPPSCLLPPRSQSLLLGSIFLGGCGRPNLLRPCLF